MVSIPETSDGRSRRASSLSGFSSAIVPRPDANVAPSDWEAKVLEMDSEKPRASRRVRTAASVAAAGLRDNDAGRGEGVGEAVVAVDAGNLFDEVDLALEVETPAGELNEELFRSSVGKCAAQGDERPLD
jgi:hypothetical protein